MLISLGVLWVFTELVYDHKQNMEESIKNRVSKVLKHIDMPTILFFLGILMSVAALQSAGLLTDFADFLDKNVHEVYTIAGITGLLSAVIDNVPLVAACMGMYPVVDTAGPGLEPRPGLYAGVRTGRYLLAPADFLRRRGRQPADYRIGRRSSGDGTGKDRIRLVPA